MQLPQEPQHIAQAANSYIYRMMHNVLNALRLGSQMQRGSSIGHILSPHSSTPKIMQSNQTCDISDISPYRFTGSISETRLNPQIAHPHLSPGVVPYDILITVLSTAVPSGIASLAKTEYHYLPGCLLQQGRRFVLSWSRWSVLIQ